MTRLLPIAAIVVIPTLAFGDPADARLRVGLGDGLGVIRSASTGSTASVTAGTAWDEARHGAASFVGAEARVWGRVFVIAGASSDAGAAWRPNVGARVSVLSSDAYPIDLAITAMYKAEGFTEPEGELELAATAGRKFGPLYALLAGAYGQDPEGRERDAELGGAVTAPIGALIASTTSRARVALGTKLDAGTAWDLIADVGAAYPFGRYAARAAFGVSAIRTTQILSGPLATFTVSAFF